MEYRMMIIIYVLSAYIGLLSIKNNRHKILIFTNKNK